MTFHSEPKLISTKKILNHKRYISFMEKDKLKKTSAKDFKAQFPRLLLMRQFADKFQLKLISEFLSALILPTTTKEV